MPNSRCCRFPMARSASGTVDFAPLRSSDRRWRRQHRPDAIRAREADRTTDASEQAPLSSMLREHLAVNLPPNMPPIPWSRSTPSLLRCFFHSDPKSGRVARKRQPTLRWYQLNKHKGPSRCVWRWILALDTWLSQPQPRIREGIE